MLDELRKTMSQECRYKPGDTLIVGVSGGPDSLALLHGLCALGIPVIAAHLDHGLRPESGDDLRFVAEFSPQLGVELVSKQMDVGAYAREKKLSVEEAGREMRYSFLFEQAEKYGAAGVAVGHNADDQVETVLMHLLRGAGLDGVSGMGYSQLTQWHNKIPLFRPLLGIWRSEIEAYCKENGISPRFDRSNLDTTFFRNRIRQELISNLESYNPNIKLALWKTANTLSEDREILNMYVNKAFQEIAHLDEENREIAYQRSGFTNMEIGMQRRLIRLGISRLRPKIRDIGYDEVEKVIAFVLNPPNSGSADLFQGLSLSVHPTQFIIFEGKERRPTPNVPHLESDEILSLPVPGEVVSNANWSVSSRLARLSPEIFQQAENNQDPMTAYLDGGKISKKLVIAPRKPGERFDPLGLDGKTTKVSDYMINLKIPQFLRDSWPLVYLENKIIWIPGYQIAHHVRVTDQTEVVAILSIQRRNYSSESE